MDGIIENLQNISVKPSFKYTSAEKRAAVLVVLGEVDGNCHVLLNKRSEKLRRHPGQVCFPGGMREEGDESAVDTALRECEEETGLSRDHISIISVLPTVRVYKSGMPLTPVIALMSPGTLSSYPFSPNPDEVADIFHVPLTSFLNPPPDCGPSCITSTSQSGTSARPQTSAFNGIVSYCVERIEAFDRHQFNVDFGGKIFNVEGITCHICICTAILGLGAPPLYPYKSPTQYCVFEESFSKTVENIVKCRLLRNSI